MEKGGGNFLMKKFKKLLLQIKKNNGVNMDRKNILRR